MLKATGRLLSKEMTYVEVWEHFKRFGDAAGPDGVTCRLLCTDSVAALLNERVRMRYLLEQFLVQNRTTAAAKAGGEPRRWWTGDFSRTVDSDRRVLAEALMEDGWSLAQVNSCVSDREWLITTMTFLKENASTQG